MADYQFVYTNKYNGMVYTKRDKLSAPVLTITTHLKSRHFMLFLSNLCDCLLNFISLIIYSLVIFAKAHIYLGELQKFLGEVLKISGEVQSDPRGGPSRTSPQNPALHYII